MVEIVKPIKRLITRFAATTKHSSQFDSPSFSGSRPYYLLSLWRKISRIVQKFDLKLNISKTKKVTTIAKVNSIIIYYKKRTIISNENTASMELKSLIERCQSHQVESIIEMLLLDLLYRQPFEIIRFGSRVSIKFVASLIDLLFNSTVSRPSRVAISGPVR